ncbi:hypothetical protein SY83_18605 [Paenibacillus swuensis]|uniref:Heptaprenyl diphosphate synthase n=1 Tax=Paenibacillus swuensis TaxID=1178515 RepID=A0A172TM41_9BACL|nr:heptaprenyl diphosphate synthase component 1 [Paenibacillus swuensis]ANE47974.1 hypothetical protein SY83_18605 [Paenibacillus swuensis]
MNTYRIPELARKYTEHDMIQKHTDLPELPDSRIRLLHTVLETHPRTSHDSDALSLATLLVQLGMDTHDMIDNQEHSDAARNNADRSRQLKVLAGDYFSSGFYHILSKAGQIEMITLLSGAICEINRMKMHLYLRMNQLKLNADEYLQQKVSIKTQLFLIFSKFMDGVTAKAWPELLSIVTKCELIVEELHFSESHEPSRSSWVFWHIWNKATDGEKSLLRDGAVDKTKWSTYVLKYNVRGILKDMLNQQLQQAAALAGQLDSDRLRRDLAQIGDSYKRYSASLVVEEI